MPRPSSHSLPSPSPAPVAALAALVATLSALAPLPAAGTRLPDAPPRGAVALSQGGGVRLAEAGARRALDATPAWRSFVARHGPWIALWNTRTGSPHRAFGPPIRLSGRLERPELVEAGVRAFIAGHRDLLGSPMLLTQRVLRVHDVWYVSFRQTVRGLPVLGADWEFRVTPDGDLFAFGVDAHRVPEMAAAGPRLPGAVARAAARLGLRFDATRDRVEGGESAALLPVATEDGLDYRAVLEARVITAEPPGDWLTYVDAATGEVLWRQDRIRYAIGGTVTGAIHGNLPTDPPNSQPFRDLRVNVGATAAITSPSGIYGATATGTVTVGAQLLGPFCDVNRQDGVPDASFSVPATNPATVNIDWAAAHDAERDAYYHLNRVHDYIKTLDPGLSGLDYPMPCAVNIADSCNAFWDGMGVNFYRAGGGCPNTATMPDVVYHEYGHGVNDRVYAEAGAPGGLVNGALHEGLADVLAAFVQDDPNAGKGFFGPGTILRSLDNDQRWPQDANVDPHVAGLILSGALWDLREAVGLPVAASLSHFAKYGVPDDLDDGVAMNEYFVETLVADKGHGNINSGTPHFAEILSAFNAHGIGTALFMDLSHTPLADQPGPGPYPVTALATYTPVRPATFGGLAGPPELHYSVNGGGYQTLTMTPTGAHDEYSASIPNQAGAAVSYYLSVTDVYGASVTAPTFAPASVYTFLAGPAITLLDHDQEVDQGWVAGDDGDDATSGIWLRTDPNSTSSLPPLEVQPGDDHTPSPGFLCWVTGNGFSIQNVGEADVDNGRTTLTTPLFDALAGGLVNPVIRYWRWYTNNQGAAPGEDLWRVDISNDAGIHWVSVESTTQSSNAWEQVSFAISGYVTPSEFMQMRFIAEDAGAASLVEAAVDDFQLLGFAPVVGVRGPPVPGGLSLTIASSQPTAGPVRLIYALPSGGPVRLRVHDLSGRAVRTLASGWRDAGGHGAEWDGRDEGGTPLPSGAYFARLEAGGVTVSRTLLRTR